MPLKTLQLRPGIFRENTRYSAEGGWYECDKVRFRSGQPEKIGGWQQVNSGAGTFLGVCRALWPWTIYLGMGTHLKYYVYYGGYWDITPLRTTASLTNPFVLATPATAGSFVIGVRYAIVSVGTTDFTLIGAASNTVGVIFTATGVGSGTGTANTNVVTVNHTAHGALTGDFVTFSGASDIGGAGPPATNVTAPVLNQEFQVTVVDANSYTIQLSVIPNVTALAAPSPAGGTVSAAYQVNVGNSIQLPPPGIGSGWGFGTWGGGVWGGSTTPFNPTQIGLWNHANFGNDLIYGPKGGGIYYWTAGGINPAVRGVNISTLPGASDTPSKALFRLVSDASRFVLAFGTTDIGSTTLNPMLIRWSAQESAANWTPSATNQAGDLLLSRGSTIEAVAQTRQEILVWTDTALYSLQYLGPPIVWGSQILADNITIVSDRAWAVAAGVVYWMGDEKFYVFDGRTSTLNCDIRKFIFDDFNKNQNLQVFASTVEQFSEVWWFYCSANSTTVDRYAVYNYAEKIWYYGTLARTAWIDASVLSDIPIATDYNYQLLYHEIGCDDGTTPTAQAIDSYIISSEFDIDDGHNFGFVTRVLPDVTFAGSTAPVEDQSLTMALLPLQNSGSGYTRGVDNVAPSANMSVALQSERTVQRDTNNGVERFEGRYTDVATPSKGNLYIRVRGRQMAIKARSNDLGVQWQLGKFRIDTRLDGRKS